jgi:uncharacterized protein YbjT (DUF2867 family)
LRLPFGLLRSNFAPQFNDMEKKLILVTNATGMQGASVARALLGNWNFRVRVLTRFPQAPTIKMLAELGAEIVTGDFSNAGKLQEAMTDVYGVFGVNSLREKEYDFNVNLIHAVKDAGIKHFIFSGQEGLKEYISRLGIPVTYLHLAAYYEDFLDMFALHEDGRGNLYFNLPVRNAKFGMVSPADVGHVVTMLFNYPKEYIGRSVAVVGDCKTPAEYASVFSDLFGRRVYARSVTLEHYAASGLTAMAQLADMFGVQRLNEEQLQVAMIESYGLNPRMRNFHSWLRRNKHKFGEKANATAEYAVY